MHSFFSLLRFPSYACQTLCWELGYGDEQICRDSHFHGRKGHALKSRVGSLVRSAVESRRDAGNHFGESPDLLWESGKASATKLLFELSCEAWAGTNQGKRAVGSGRGGRQRGLLEERKASGLRREKGSIRRNRATRAGPPGTVW